MNLDELAVYMPLVNSLANGFTVSRILNLLLMAEQDVKDCFDSGLSSDEIMCQVIENLFDRDDKEGGLLDPRVREYLNEILLDLRNGYIPIK